jgi:transcriptional regulator with XRE-family HTH domain
MMTNQELLNQEKETKEKMSLLLISIREANGIENPFIVSRELGQSVATLRNIEKGISFPTSKTLNELMGLYMLTIEERKALIQLKNKMLQIRKQIKESRK